MSLLSLLLLVSATAPQSPAGEPVMRSLTPVLPVERIEPCLPFWERLGFARLDEVPHGEELGFVILGKGEVQVMYQSRASLREDLPGLAEGDFRSAVILYVKVSELDPLLPVLEQGEVVVPLRTTFYGAREIFVREPGGSVVAFTQHPE